MIIDGILGLRRLGIRDAQEPSRATFADPSEGCIIKMYFWRGTAYVAEPIYHIGYGLLLHYKRFIRRGEGEERLVGEQDKDRENYAHLSKSYWRVMEPYQGSPTVALYDVDLTPPAGISLGARGDKPPVPSVAPTIIR